MQRQLSSFDIYVIVSELQELKENYIDQIYQLTRNEILIRVKNIKTKQKDNIFIRNGMLICLTKKQIETPMKPSTFAMTLRKYLLNGRITEIKQHEFDRIIKFKISKKEGDYTLVIEFFSDGNIILINPEEKIIIPLIRQQWAHRSIKGKEPYIPPPSQTNPFNLTKQGLKKLIRESSTDLVRTLAVNVNLSGIIAEEICKRANVDKNIKIEDIDDNSIDKIFTSLTKFLNLFNSKKFESTYVKKEGKVIDILPFEFKSYFNVDFEKTEKFVRGLGSFIDKKEPKVKKKGDLEQKIAKLNRQLQQQLATVTELKHKIEEKKLEGDLIYLNYEPLEKLLNKITKLLELKDKESQISDINNEEIVKKFSPTENILIVNLKDTYNNIFEIKINFRKTVSQNAERAYNDNKKLRSKLNGAKKSIKKTKEQIELIKKKDIKEKQEEKVVKRDRILWFERFRWFISSDGNIVIGGKDAKSNELVVKKYLKDGDRYVHADIQGAPSCIIKSKDIKDKSLEISEKTLEEACVFAASFSKAWKQFAEAQAYWVLPEQVSKTAQSGEFVPKGAFIIRGKRNYNKCKLELAVGKIIINNDKKIMCGPVDAISKRTEKYVVIKPGDIKKIDLAHKLARLFDASIDSVDRVLPPGGATIVKSVGLQL